MEDKVLFIKSEKRRLDSLVKEVSVLKKQIKKLESELNVKEKVDFNFDESSIVVDTKEEFNEFWNLHLKLYNKIYKKENLYYDEEGNEIKIINDFIRYGIDIKFLFYDSLIDNIEYNIYYKGKQRVIEEINMGKKYLYEYKGKYYTYIKNVINECIKLKT